MVFILNKRVLHLQIRYHQLQVKASMRFIQTLLLILTLSTFAQAQDTIPSTPKYQTTDTTHKEEMALCLVVGYNVWAYHFGEIGFSVAHSKQEGYETVGTNIYLTSEIKLDNQLMLGPKAGIWIGSSTGGLGLNTTYYTDLDQGALCIKPEMGIGMSRFKLTYGYNFNLTNKEFNRFNKHVISLNLSLDLLKLN